MAGEHVRRFSVRAGDSGPGPQGVSPQFHAPSESIQGLDIQYMDGAVLHSHEAGCLQFVQGTVRDLTRQAAQARDLLWQGTITTHTA